MLIDMSENNLITERKSISDLMYAEDEHGNDLVCYLDSSPYTGIVFEALSSGSVTTEYEVKDGLKDGAEIEYYSKEQPASITHYRKGYLHGDVIYYYPDGSQKERSVFEYGLRREVSEWDENGNLTHHSSISEADENYKLIEKLRAKYNW
jgi:antitoxin component YwqK of YwqJK toxin-antitoxin module